MKGKLYIFKPGQRVPETRDLFAPLGHLDIHAIVGGPIELVPGFNEFDGERCAVFCHEEGKLIDPPLPANNVATALWADTLGMPVYVLAGRDFLVGTIAIVTGDDELMNAM